MVEGKPDWSRFQRVIEEALRNARNRVANAAICAYGEMVGVLWEAGQTSAAVQLEEYWNKLLHRGGITLFCGYPIDVFANDFQRTRIHDVLRAHSHVMPTSPNSDLRWALDRAMDDLLGAKADEVRSSIKSGVPSTNLAMPEVESAILWLRSNVPERAEEILTCARSYFAAALNSGYAGEMAAI